MIAVNLIGKYRNANNKLILLDYDGTLVDFVPTPEDAIPSETLLTTLLSLTGKPKTRIIIITGRSHQDIDNYLGSLPIDIIAEHGAMIKENGKWQILASNSNLWKNEAFQFINQITSTCPKSFVEEKHFSLSWHYRNTESESGYACSRELIRVLETYILSYNLKILDGNKVVEIMSKEVGKGKAVKNIVEQNNYDYILSIGDDKTDEEMFEYLLHKKSASTIKVGGGSTFAKYRLDNVNKVISLLETLSICD